MPNAPLIPTVRRRRLGSTLRKLRNDSGLTLDQAAAAVGWQGPKVSKIENATQGLRPTDLTGLLKAYDVTDPDVHAALEALRRDASKRGWWQTYSEVVRPPYADYISLESDADRISTWSPLLIPGLLQTAAYARETIAGITTSRTAEEVSALAEVRLARQSVLSRPDSPPKLWAVIHEAALHQRFAVRPATMRDQLRRLLDASELPNVTVQIMPLDSTPHPGLVGEFTIATFGPPLPDLVALENLGSTAYLEGVETVTFTQAYERIRATALPPEDSLVRITELKEGHRQ